MKSRASVIAFLCLSACFERALSLPEDTVGNGFYCTTSPSEAYGPGYVYRTDRAGNDSLVDVLTDRVETYKFEMANRTVTAKAMRGVGLKLELTGPIGSVASASADAAISSGRESLVTFEKGNWLQMTDKAARALEALAVAELSPVPNNTYYAVRDVVQARTFQIELSGEDTRTFGGAASIVGLINASPQLSLVNSRTIKVNSTDGPLMNVCFRAFKLEPDLTQPAPASGGTVWRLTDEVASAQSVARALSSQ